MDCNKEEARKAIKIAEKKLSKKDYKGAKRFARKAKTLYPTLDGLVQISTMIDVYISCASNKTNGSESDWYGILSVDPLADDEALKKQYKKLALLLHPDKNKFTGATEAFKLISEAWCVLSDKSKRLAYDLKRKPTDIKSGMYQKEPKRHKPDFPWNKADFPWNRGKDQVGTFWTKCDRCNTYCQFGTDSAYLKKTLSCPNCRQAFVVTEIEFKQKQN